MKFLKSIAICLALSLPAMAFGATYYVATDGNNVDPGTEAEPWLTISYAQTQVVAGDTVLIRGGTYNEQLIVSTSGTSGSPITYKAYTGETPIIDGAGLDFSSYDAIVWTWNAAYITLDGLTIQGAVHGADWPYGLKLWGNNGGHWTVQNCTIRNNDGLCAIMATSLHDYFTLDNCDIYGNTTAAMEAVRIDAGDGACNYFKITNNRVHDNSYIGIDIVSWGALSQYGLIQNNVSYRNSLAGPWGSSIYIDGAAFVTIQDNICYDSEIGISIGSESAGTTTSAIIVRRNVAYGARKNGFQYGSGWANGRIQDCAVYNNTFYRNHAQDWRMEVAIGYYLGSSMFVNNIFYSDQDVLGSRILWCHAGTTVTAQALAFDYNCWYPSSGENYNVKGVDYASLAAWQSNFSIDLNSIGDDPLFVDADNKNFQLSVGSPCIDAGNSLTVCSNSGTGTILTVVNPYPFTDGYNGLFFGDAVVVGGNVAVTVTAVDYEANSITVSSSITWSVGDPVSLEYAGNAPDIGASDTDDAIPGKRRVFALASLGDARAFAMKLFASKRAAGYCASLTDEWIESVTYPYTSFASSRVDITTAIESVGDGASCYDIFSIELGAECRIEFDLTVTSGTGISVGLATDDVGTDLQLNEVVVNGHVLIDHVSTRTNATEHLMIFLQGGSEANFTVANFSIKKKL